METTTKSSIQEDALQAILPYTRSSACMSMGTGKSKLGLMHMDKNYTDYCKFLVVAPKKSIFQSWKDDIEKFDYQHLLPHITFTTYLSLDKQENDWDVIYLDEMHSLLDSHDYFLSMYGGKIVGLTGTAPRFKSSEKGKMVEKYCPVVYNYSTDDAIEDNILNDYEIRVHTLALDTSKTILVTRPDKQWYTSEQDIYNYWTKRIDEATGAKETQMMNILRMKAIQGFPTKHNYAKKLLNSNNKKCLLFCNTQEQADKYQYSYHSKNPDSEKNLTLFKSGEIKKMASVLQLGEGINIPELEEIIICHSFSGNSPKTQQFLGRALRLSTDRVAQINILMYENSVDEKWVKSALESFNQSKISYI